MQDQSSALDGIWTNIVSNGLLMGFLIFLLFLLVVAATVLIVAAVTLRRRLKSTHAIIDQFDATDLVHTRQYALEKSRERGTPDKVKFLWGEFDETLVEVRGRARLDNTVDARDMFNTETMGPELVHSRWLAFLPTAMTAVGLLGTFTGLMIGLVDLNLTGGDGVATGELEAGVQQLLSGVSLAFTTSVAGVSFSLLTNAARFITLHRASRKIAEAQKAIDSLFNRHTPERSLVEIEKSAADSTLALNDLHEKIGTKLQETVKEMSSSMEASVTQALESALGPMLQEIASNSHNQAGETLGVLIDEFASTFKEFGTSQAESLGEATAGLSRSAANIQGSLDTTLQTLEESNTHMRKDVQAAVDDTVNAMQEQRQGFESQLTQFMETIQDERRHSVELAQQLADIVSAAGEAMTSSSSDLNSSSRQVRTAAQQWNDAAAQMDSHREKFATDLSQLTDKHTESLGMLSGHNDVLRSLTNSSERTVDLISSAAQESTRTFHELRERQSEFLTELEDGVERLQKQMHQWLNDYSHQVNEQTTTRMNEWNDQSREYATRMRDIAESMAGYMDEIETLKGSSSAHSATNHR